MPIVDFIVQQENSPIQIILESEEVSNSKFKLMLTYIDYERNRFSSGISYDVASDELAVFGTDMNTGYAACLLLAGLGHVVQEVLMCRRDGNTTAGAMLRCLGEKGVSIKASLASIAIACMTSSN